MKRTVAKMNFSKKPWVMSARKFYDEFRTPEAYLDYLKKGRRPIGVYFGLYGERYPNTDVKKHLEFLELRVKNYVRVWRCLPPARK